MVGHRSIFWRYEFIRFHLYYLPVYSVFASDYFKSLISSLVCYTLFIVICINFLSGESEGVSSYRIVKSLSALLSCPSEYIVAATAAYKLQRYKTTGAAGSCITLNSNPRFVHRSWGIVFFKEFKIIVAMQSCTQLLFVIWDGIDNFLLLIT